MNVSFSKAVECEFECTGLVHVDGMRIFDDLVERVLSPDEDTSVSHVHLDKLSSLYRNKFVRVRLL